MGGADEAMAANGINGTAQPQTPPRTTPSRSDLPLARTPSLHSFSLTEYSAKPTAPTEDRKTHMKKIVPDEFLLPNGNPDVSYSGLPSLPPITRGGCQRAGMHTHLRSAETIGLRDDYE